MAFHNYEGVKKVQEERERNENIEQGSENDEVFFKQLKDMGINLDRETLDKNRRRSSEEDLDDEDLDDEDLDDIRVMKRE